MELPETLLVVEAGDPVPWCRSLWDLAYSPDAPLPSLGGVFTKPVRLFCRTWKSSGSARFPSPRLLDGSIQFITSDVDEATMRSLITRNGGETG